MRIDNKSKSLVVPSDISGFINATISDTEYKIQANLVYGKCSGELIGYEDLGNTKIDYSTFEKVDDIAIRALVYIVRGVASDLKFYLPYLATKGIKSDEIMSIFWEEGSILELISGLKMIAAVSDEASANKKKEDCITIFAVKHETWYSRFF